MFEHKHEPLLPHPRFALRVLGGVAIAVGVVAASLMVGAMGYHWLEGLPWLDATLNAAMILTGMGPVDRLQSDAGKVFAIAYALFSGVAFLGVMAVVLAPIVHRLLHHFHLESAEDESESDSR